MAAAMLPMPAARARRCLQALIGQLPTVATAARAWTTTRPRTKVGSSDPRCPANCPHKASEGVAVLFTEIFNLHGAKAAAEMARSFKEKSNG